MFIKLIIQASISKGIEGEIHSILNETEEETFETECMINTDDISHFISSNDGTTTIYFKSQEDSMVTLTPLSEIENALNRGGN
jgi:hypothetical protein